MDLQQYDLQLMGLYTAIQIRHLKRGLFLRNWNWTMDLQIWVQAQPFWQKLNRIGIRPRQLIKLWAKGHV